jgi:hypothetical protein
MPPNGSAAELVRILDQYLANLQAGGAPDRGQLLAEHPALAAQLEACLAGIEFIHRATRTVAADEAPTQLGEFRILRELGRGGMGVVYEAEQTSLRRRVALKVLRFGVVADPEAMERFQREAETVARLHHTNIVPIFAVGSERGVQYYAMQYIAGRSLADVQTESERSGQPPAGALVARWGLQAAEALAHAHQRGVIHRDVKPSNLILDAEGVVWLTDFGLAKRVDEVTLTISGALMGTPRYMSPEQVEAIRRPVDHRTDLYSLGATLYELATGRPLFDAATPHAVLSQILTVEPPRPRLVRPGLSRDLETVILTCLAKDPGKRYATAQALADDLRAVLDGRPIQARRAPWTERLARSVRKHKKALASAATAVAACLLLVAASYAAWRWYADWRLGRVVLTTDGPPLTADVLPAGDDTPVTEPFTIGTSTPLALPAGDYRLRLRAPGRLGRTVRVGLNRGETVTHRVSLEQGLLFGSEAISYAHVTEAITFGPGRKADLVEWTGPTLIRRDGTTGKPVWDLARPEKPWPADRDPAAWIRRLGNRGDNTSPGRILVPAPDLDGDGIGDLVLALAESPSLLALSGRDGSFLWASTATPDGPRPPDGTPSKGWVVGLPIATDANHDGTSDLIATFALSTTVKGDVVGGQEGYFVAAVSGVNGQALWSRVLDSQSRKLGSKDTRAAPVLVRRRGGLVVGVLGPAAMIWQEIDPASGTSVETPIDFGFEPIRPVQSADLDGDGLDELLALGPGPTIQPVNQDQTLSAVSGATRRPLWTVTVRGAYALNAFAVTPEWPLVADLDRDGRAEVAVPDWRRFPPSGGYRGVALLDGATGRARWSQPLRPWTDGSQGLDHLAVAPDLDGDGVRDVVAVSRFHGRDSYYNPTQRPAEPPRVYVDALSGRGGQTLWWWRRALEDGTAQVGAPRWWGRGPDGGPLLAIPVGGNLRDSPVQESPRSDPRDEPPNVHVLTAASGREVHTIAGLSWPRAADLDGDGLDDLWGMAAGQLRAFRGEAPEAWRALGEARPAGDLDGDGVADVVSGDLLPPPRWGVSRDEVSESRTLVARSGRDGHVLWRAALDRWANWATTTPFRSYEFIVFPRGGDLDGDGVTDIVVNKSAAPIQSHGQLAMEVRSGRDGRQLYSVGSIPKAKLAIPKGYQPSGSDAADDRFLGAEVLELAGRRGADLLVLHSAGVSVKQTQVEFPYGIVPSAVVFRLSRFSGRDGRLIWDTPLNEPALKYDFHKQFAHALGDLDGDGVPDLVLPIHIGIVPGPLPAGERFPEGRYALVAVSLRQGKRLWTRPLRRVGGFPPTTFEVGDLDGDGRAEVVVADRPTDAAKEPVEISAVDGRDGSLRWTWRGGNESDRSHHGDIPFCLVAFEGDGPRTVCLNTGLPKNARRLVLLDAQGREKAGQVLGRKWWLTLGHGDLDGDGREELLIQYDGKLRAVGGDLKERWSWPCAVSPHGILPARAGLPATVVLHSNIGLDGANGRPRWTGLDTGWIADPGSKTEPARLVRGDPDFAACRLALPTDPAGNLFPPRVVPERPGARVRDPRWMRRLPWASTGWSNNEPLGLLALGGLACIFLMGPSAILRLLERRRVRSRWLLLTLPAMVGIWLAALLTVSAIALLILLGGLPADLRLGWPLWLFGASVLGLPVSKYVFILAADLIRRRWTRLTVLLGSTVLAALALGAFLLRDDLRIMQPFESFDWSQWYGVLPLGVYAIGVLLLAIGATRRIARRVQRWLARRSVPV